MMHRAACRALTLAGALLHAAAAPAAEDGRTFKASVDLSRHHTDNVLDGPLALADWYTLLRGAVEETLVHERGATRIAGALELRRHDTYAIEDDAALSLAAETTVRVSETLELRGTLSMRLVDEGDDIAVGDAIVGIRTAKAIAGAGVQAGLVLSPGTTLVIEAAARHDRIGETHFEAGLLPDARLEPHRNRLRFAATLTHTEGSFSHGLFAGTGYTVARPLGILPRIEIFDHTLKIQSQLSLEGGPTLAAAAGLQLLDVPAASFRQVRPTYEIAAVLPLAPGLGLRGALKAGYDMISSDDPVAVRLRRLEIEASYRATPALTFGAGLFAQERDFVGLGTGETGRGAYGEAVWQAREKLAVVLRLDVARHLLLPFNIERRGIDTQLAVRASL